MSEALTYIGWLAVVILAIFGGLILVILVRRWASAQPTSEPLTLEELRQLHAQGRVTDEEFRVIRTTLLEKMGLGAEKRPSGAESPKHPPKR